MARFPSASRRLAAVGVAITALIAPSAIAHADPPLDQPDQIAEIEPGAAAPVKKPTAIVAFGDSFISGEGAGSYKPVRDRNGVDRTGGSLTEDNSIAFYCHRSSKAFVEVARLPGIDARFNLSCSGGMAPDIMHASADRPYGRNVASQLDQLRQISRDYDIEAVVIGLGANNTQFTFGQMAIGCAGLFATDAYFRDEVPRVRNSIRNLNFVLQRYFSSDALKDLRNALTHVNPCTYSDYQQHEAAIEQETQAAARAIVNEVRKTEGDDFKVIMQGYTSPLTAEFTGEWAKYVNETEADHKFKGLFGWRFDGGCPVHNDTLKVATQTTEFLSRSALATRDRLASEFPNVDFVYLDVERAFDGARLCEPNMRGTKGSLVTPLQILYPATGGRRTFDSNWSFADLQAVAASCEEHYQLCQESLHPNAAGHKVLGQCLSAAVTGTSGLVKCKRVGRNITFEYQRRSVDFNTSATVTTSGSNTLVDLAYAFDYDDRSFGNNVIVTTNQANASVKGDANKRSGTLQLTLPCTVRGRTTHIDVKAEVRLWNVPFTFTTSHDVQVAPCPMPRLEPGGRAPISGTLPAVGRP